jgi:hypothetical protein
MKYADGTNILAGDFVQFDGNYCALVIAAIESRSYLPGYRCWSLFGSGIVVLNALGGIVHFSPKDAEAHLVLMARKLSPADRLHTGIANRCRTYLH